MFIRHTADFANVPAHISPIIEPNAPGVVLGQDTRLETQAGFINAGDLKTGDAIATLDGGFVHVTGRARLRSTNQAVSIPAGALGNCSKIVLPNTAHIGIELPETAERDAAFVAVPAGSLVGFRRIRPAPFGYEGGMHLTLASEEMIWAQTGLLLHATGPDGDQPFFDRLGYGDARGILALMDHAKYGPDCTISRN